MTAGTTLSHRGHELAAPTGFAEKFKSILGNPYDPDTNPDGFVDIGTAENHVMLPDAAKFLQDNPLELSKQNFSYGEGPWGNQRLRKAMAGHLNRYLKPLETIQPDDLHFGNGCTALCEMLGFTLFDEGDGILFTQPVYQGFPLDFGSKAKVKCVYVPFHDVDQFSPSCIPKYEAALSAATAAGTRIRALMLCHPHNPLGQPYPIPTLIAIMKFCNTHRIHLISDEIYALSVYSVPNASFSDHIPFHSVLSLPYKDHIDPDLLHVMYGMSKDLAGGGLRLGCLFIKNKELKRGMDAINQFHWPGIADVLIATKMLEDVPWMHNFVATSRKRLAQNNAIARELLASKNIPFSTKSNAGFFLWVDLRDRLPKTNGEGKRLEGVERERELGERFFGNMVNVVPGEAMAAEEVGFWRVVFSQDERVLREGLRRMFEVLEGVEGEK
ncbi:PLP-dependent transferase [Saccharata proteae CBS 121410]|uniref:PLP-dependent transferase n=1 Tax=Saccharata proteae CBS 121410 TaxID=1314787 RepID=A0A6A5YEE3_9PEZI|nr:PLP-dependent transferase [Saccharata proteae CBS 121410]